ncbi:MAG TPA: YbhB/YbcL family Raf kinase inhibitor-like protein [Steroidobacteraceae bacterium]|nr:YbhB/YbcL family Raf kinase inhibitor-like protein [Steroidobacteraceae bacterium]
MKRRGPAGAPARGWPGAWAAALAAGALVVTGAGAAVPPWLFAIGHAKALAVTLVSPAAQSRLVVTSRVFDNGGVIPCRNTQYCGNVFPGLAWSAGPTGTRSYVVIMQGPGEGAEVSLHLTVFNIPTSVRHLPAGLSSLPAGASLGPNVHGLHHSYAGPHPQGEGRNEYHLQVFALDVRLHVSRSVTFEKLITAMRSHVLADGQLVGFATKPSH